MGTLSKWQLSRSAARGFSAALQFRGEILATTFFTPVYTWTGGVVGWWGAGEGGWGAGEGGPVTWVMAPPNMSRLKLPSTV